MKLTESINDKHIFKAVFMVGPPASGKSTFIKKVADSNWGAKKVNPDKFVEYIAKKTGTDISVPKDTGYFIDDVRRLRVPELAMYVNGMLPLFIDSTGQNVARTIRRVEILEGFGYDTFLVWVGTDLQSAILNAKIRADVEGRAVPMSVVMGNYKTIKRHIETYKKEFGSDFYYHENVFLNSEESRELNALLFDKNVGKPYDEKKLHRLEMKYEKAKKTENSYKEAHKALNKFFNSPVKNYRGKKFVDKIEAHTAKYLSPTIFSMDKIASIIEKEW